MVTSCCVLISVHMKERKEGANPDEATGTTAAAAAPRGLVEKKNICRTLRQINSKIDIDCTQLYNLSVSMFFSFEKNTTTVL